MTDNLTITQRADTMRRVKSRDTKPELIVRKSLHKLGARFRLDSGHKLPGKPDIVLPSRKVVVFVHGCFWHQCPNCEEGARIPKSNVEYWKEKLKRNTERDKQHINELKKTGWKSITIWECEIKDEKQLKRKINGLLRKRKELSSNHH